ncbi:MAG: M23 family metallopeptidase [Oscillospiraceae bacterium]|nr:M23 family metallopeptidase [Oscillospiraceae bacterium]
MARFPMQKIGITAGYGPYTVSGVRKPHYGCDICSQSNTNVVACHAGRVVLSCWDSAGGNMIALQGPFNGKCEMITRYAHLASRRVSLGQSVAEGEVIGVQGATGSACFGRHLHLETWLVPIGYSYNYAGRVEYSVDPLSVLHVVSGQQFVADEDTFYLGGIPEPEPAPQGLISLPKGAKLKVQNGAVRLRLVPFTEYTPLTANASDRSRDTLGEFFSETEFDALMYCESETAGAKNRWALIETPLGEWWTALIEGYTSLEGAGDLKEEAEREIASLAACREAISAAVALLEPYMKKED